MHLQALKRALAMLQGARVGLQQGAGGGAAGAGGEVEAGAVGEVAAGAAAAKAQAREQLRRFLGNQRGYVPTSAKMFRN